MADYQAREIANDMNDPRNQPDCEPDSTYCHQVCEPYKKGECQLRGHKDNECWDECPYCEE